MNVRFLALFSLTVFVSSPLLAFEESDNRYSCKQFEGATSVGKILPVRAHENNISVGDAHSSSSTVRIEDGKCVARCEGIVMQPPDTKALCTQENTFLAGDWAFETGYLTVAITPAAGSTCSDETVESICSNVNATITEGNKAEFRGECCKSGHGSYEVPAEDEPLDIDEEEEIVASEAAGEVAEDHLDDLF